MRRTFKLVVAYDGTAFHGWQRQTGRRTVQADLERALADVLGEEIQLSGAGRTDAGVHARGQVASFRWAGRLPARAVEAKLGRAVSDDVRVLSLGEADGDFDARRSARGRRYAYHLLRDDDLLLGRYAWRPATPFDAGSLTRASSPLEGTHDFSAFQSSGSSRPSPVCRVWRATWSSWDRGLRFDIVADRFLYRMVRTIVGTVLRAGRERDPAAHVRAVLASRDRARAAPPAPARGLSLEEVFYVGGKGGPR
jgi:tRNA pseudouridine38-40 synthase